MAGFGTGTTVVWDVTETSRLVEAYWWAGHVYASGDSCAFTLTAHPDPQLGGKFADDSVPSQLDQIADYGSLGFGANGYLPCPSALGDDNGQGQGLQQLTGYVPDDIRRLGLVSIDHLPDNTQMRLALQLPLRDRNGLARLVQGVSSPTSPSYRHYITPTEFAERFGPRQEDRREVETFARSHNLTVVPIRPKGLVVDVAGSVADIQRAFHVHFLRYQHPTEHRTFFAPDVEPSLDLRVPLRHVEGLNDYRLPQPLVQRTPTSRMRLNPSGSTRPSDPVVHPAPPARIMNVEPYANGSGPYGTYIGNDFRQAYVPGIQLTGRGQKLAHVSLWGL